MAGARLRGLLCCGFFACLMGVPGCGPDLGTPTTLTGKVTVDGEPLSNAALAFHTTEEERPAEYRTFTAKTDAGGQYTVAQIYPGNYEVTVVDTSATSAEADADAESALAGESFRPAGDSSDLTVRVGSQPTRFDIELTRTQGQ